MNLQQRTSLQQKRGQLQRQLRFEAFASQYVAPLLEVLGEMQRLDISYRVVSLRAVPSELQAMLLGQLRTDSLMQYKLPAAPIEADTNLLQQLMERYPTPHTSRYFPELPVVAMMDTPSAVLQNLIREQNLTGQHVFLCWLQYAFLLEADLQQLAAHADNDILDIRGDDVVPFPADFDWLIVYNAFEDQWRFGGDEAWFNNF